GSYHSIYDSFVHYTRFGDPGGDYGIALAQTGGRIVLRFADADYLPLSFNNLTDTVALYVHELTKLSDDTREEIKETNLRLKDKTFEAVSDPTETYVAPKREAPAPYLNFAPLQNALVRLQESTNKFETVMRDTATRGRLSSKQAQMSLDAALLEVEHAMTRGEGLPRRPWFKHQLYAPGFYTGYGVKTLPGVREAIEQRNWIEADQQISIVSATIVKIAEQIDRATAAATR
nr:folate hydrolase [Acidobacteriota bacterium]